ncbi:MAG TPA: peroxiredoxin-like family protein [Candidatus Acidoferrales bacterium]|nr:peroxiredoxin-like family protein [Candidatus Acidoferrales bacterium]
MSLSKQLEELTIKLHALVPAERLAIIDREVEKLKSSGIAQRVVKVGDTAPAFELYDGDGMLWRSQELLRSGPLVIVFYRGRWCAYCNAQLAALREHHSAIAAAGASLAAVSPQTQKHSYMTRDMHKLRFHVLSDPGNQTAGKFGLVWRLSLELQSMYQSIMTKLPGYNGDENWDLPMPATYIVQPDGKISFAWVDVDWRERPEPEQICEHINHKGHEGTIRNHSAG